jgi:type II secretion system protein H
MTRTNRKHPAGFTLVETLVVVVVIGLVLAVAVPNLAQTNRGRRVEAAANDIAARINLERQRTIATRIPHRIVLDPGSHQYRTERLASDSTWAADGDSVYAVPAQVIWGFVAGADPTNADIEFESRGTVLAEDAPLVIHFSDAEGDSAIVTLVRTGRVTVRRGAP